MSEHTPSRPAHLWIKAALVWCALSVALAATVAGAYLDIGAWKLPLALAIATLKAALVVVLFMEFIKAGPGARIAILVGALWFALLLALTFADEATRAQF